jgi:hypothetical protein
MTIATLQSGASKSIAVETVFSSERLGWSSDPMNLKREVAVRFVRVDVASCKPT